jgi:glycosyltransferase involved in cell wall biosynthesis
MLKALGLRLCHPGFGQPVYNREILQDGKYGWFFQKETSSVAEVTDKAEDSLQEMEQLRRTAVNGLTKKYDWKHVTGQYLEVFQELRK